MDQKASNYTEINNTEDYLPLKKEEQDIIDALLLSAPLFQKIMPIDCMIGITDTIKFYNIFFGEKIKIDVNPVGLAIPEQDAIAQAIHNNTTIDMVVPKEAFGFEFRSLAIPLKNKSGKIFGGLGVGFDLENSSNVNFMAQQVATSTVQTSSVIQELSASAEELSNSQLVLQSHAKIITDKIEETNNILEFINNIASTSSMLGLNAAIEAARAGEAGKGFSVVASEIRKMSENSSKSVTDIKEIIGNIKDAMNEINNNIEQIVSIGQQQAASTEELSASTQELITISKNLENASHKVIG